MIVTVNLAQGRGGDVAQAKVIVKRLDAIQNFGAMDVLCTDKTGTLTQDKVILERHLDAGGEENEQVLEYAYLNSHFQTGLKNLLDRPCSTAHDEHRSSSTADALRARSTRCRSTSSGGGCRSSSTRGTGAHVLICKGAAEEIFARLHARAASARQVSALDRRRLRAGTGRGRRSSTRTACGSLRSRSRTMPRRARPAYGVADEAELDAARLHRVPRPAEGQAAPALAGSARARAWRSRSSRATTTWSPGRSAGRSGCDAITSCSGSEIEAMGDDELRELAERTTRVRQADAGAEGARSSRRSAARAGTSSASSATASTTARPCKAADVGISVDTRRRHRQGVGRHHPAREEPAGARGGRGRGAARSSATS